MTTQQLVQQAGVVAVTVALLLSLVVVVLRLLSLPLAVGALVLDKSADLAARPMTFTTPPTWRARR
jgi:hypothetical protein